MSVSALDRRRPAVAVGAGVRKVIDSIVDRMVRSINTIGRSARLAMEVVRFSVTDTLTLRLALGEVIEQMWKLFKVTALPALLMAVPIGAEVSVQVGGVMDQVGANSLAGAASGLGVVSQGAPMAAGLLMSGAAASAIASDLGARSIREEIEAMRVMGVNPVQRLIVPRFIAMVAISPALCIIIVASGVAAGLAISRTSTTWCRPASGSRSVLSPRRSTSSSRWSRRCCSP